MNETETDETFEAFVDEAKVWKEKHGEEVPELVAFYRDERHVASFGILGLAPPGESAAGPMLEVAMNGSALFRADRVAVAADSRGISGTLPKDTPPDEVEKRVRLPIGELDRRWAAGDREGISEYLSIYSADRSGAAVGVSIRYDFVDGRPVWAERFATAGATGMIPTNLAEGMRIPAVDVLAIDGAPPEIAEILRRLPDEERDAMSDTMAALVIGEQVPVVADLVFGSEAEARLSASVVDLLRRHL